MAITVRPVMEDDAPAIVALLNPIIQAGIYTVMDEPITEDDQIAFIRELPERSIYHAAIDDDSQRLVGIQDFLPSYSEAIAFRHVGDISTFVALDAQQQGVGRQLTEATSEVARRLGFAKMCATIRGDNPRAVAFYLGQGFRVIGTAYNHAFIRGRYIDEILAEKFIGWGTGAMAGRRTENAGHH